MLMLQRQAINDIILPHVYKFVQELTTTRVINRNGFELRC